MNNDKSFAIVAPCYNERDGITQFLDELEQVLSCTLRTFNVFVIDDGSEDDTLSILRSYRFNSPKFSLHSLSLQHNLGHQAAIRQGLIYIAELDQRFDGIIIMDSDGEDDPNGILKMLEIGQAEIIFAERGDRQENISFRLSYLLYKVLFKMITGRKINFGNFSMINSDVLQTISHQDYRHFASFLSKQNFKIDKIKVDKRVRISGKSKMNYKALFYHGIYSIIE
jgi:polyisoprenyl-phosphate glycosyltransferase